MKELSDWHENAKNEIRQLQELLNAGGITIAEYEELVEDILDLEKISNLLVLEEYKIQAQKILEGLSALARLV